MENGGDTEESQSVLREPWGLARLTKRACHIHLGEKEAQVLKGKQEWSPLPTGLVGVLPLQIFKAPTLKCITLILKGTWGLGTDRDTVNPGQTSQRF